MQRQLQMKNNLVSNDNSNGHVINRMKDDLKNARNRAMNERNSWNEKKKQKQKQDQKKQSLVNYNAKQK